MMTQMKFQVHINISTVLSMVFTFSVEDIQWLIKVDNLPQLYRKLACWCVHDHIYNVLCGYLYTIIRFYFLSLKV